MRKLEKFLERLNLATAHEDFQRATSELQEHYKVNHVVYHWVNSVGERFGAGTYSTEWVDRYLERDYLYIDPVVVGCFNRFTPVNWKELDWSTKAAQSFLKEAVEFGVGPQGLSIPIRGPNGQYALFTVSHACLDDEWEKFIERNQKDLMIVGHAFNQRALAFEELNFSTSQPMLSPREVSSIALLAKGRSRAQAAAEMSISEHTLRVYIEAARHKLGALNTTHAVARALSMGLIVV